MESLAENRGCDDLFAVFEVLLQGNSHRFLLLHVHMLPYLDRTAEVSISQDFALLKYILSLIDEANIVSVVS